jgi:polyisoprenoid-binding protein YceI
MRCASLVKISAIAVVLGALSVPAIAQTFAVDKPHTIVAFTVDRQGLTKMLGRFTRVDGEFTLDRNNPAASTVKLTIDTTSVFTGFEARDKHLRSPDFFNVQEFPQMTFVSTKVERAGESSAKISGNLTLLGVTKPVTLDATLNGIKPNPRTKKDLAGFSVRGTLKRSEFGMKYLLGPIGDDVSLRIELLGEAK